MGHPRGEDEGGARAPGAALDSRDGRAQADEGKLRERVRFPRRKGKPLSNMAMLAVLKRMGRDDLTAHGFRSTFRDWAAERTNFPREVVEMALAHAIENKVAAAYRRGDLFQKRRQLMEAWAQFDRTRGPPGQHISGVERSNNNQSGPS